MDPRVAGAGVAMAVAMMVMLPTFNALNDSYVENVAPPAWLAKFIDPNDLPDDFQPPDDFVPPEGYEPPPDFEPPPGWEPPPGYDGPIPPGGCPPPLIQPIQEWTVGPSTIDPQDTTLLSADFVLPKNAAGFGGYMNFTQWQGSSVEWSIDGPDGNVDSGSENGGPAGLLIAPQPKDTSFSYQTPEDKLFPAQGTYTLTLSVSLPIGGSFETEFAVAIPCGGMLQ